MRTRQNLTPEGPDDHNWKFLPGRMWTMRCRFCGVVWRASDARKPGACKPQSAKRKVYK